MDRTTLLLLLALLLAPPILHAQDDPFEPDYGEPPVTATPADARLDAVEQRRSLAERSLVDRVPFRSVGPTIISGRVVDVDADPDDPTRFYVAYASGGLWRTTNNGQSFEPLFDHEASMTLGDIYVDWNHGETIWLGTGENNSSRSSYAGTGVYVSRDRGATWQHRGLAETQHTGRILVHPDDPQTVWVAAMGRLYSPNEHRGVYRSDDGGATWARTLYVDENTGAIDLVMDPTDPDVLYAATWERARRAWDFDEDGEGSGIWRSDDGGRTWSLLTNEASGFPTGPGVGRIGLAVYPGDPDILYALLDNQYHREEPEDEQAPTLTRDMLRTMSRDAFLEVAEEALEAYLERNGFPASYTTASIYEMVRDGELEPVALVEYLEDSNRRLFDTPVIGAEVYRSDDGGRSWRRTHEEPIDETYYSYGYYFGEIRVAPETPDRIYVLGVPLLRSDDGGQTFTGLDRGNVHVDHHALWVHPSRPGHLIDGNDGGINVSYDDGATWFKANTPPVAQFYAVQVDMAEPYNVYGGMQDNGVWFGPHTYEHDYAWYGEGDYPYDRLMGGDGMMIEIDPRGEPAEHRTVITGFQFGYYYRLDRATGERTLIRPRHELGQRPLRFNWQTPIHLSRHDPDVLYLGSNKIHRSFDQGRTWETLTGDLTQGGRPGNVPYGTLTSIDESPLRFGLLYAGTDDGLVHVSRDAGYTWRRVSDPLPDDLWVSRVEASPHDTARAYVALNGYRWDHFTPYLYRTDDYGRSWARLGTDLPPEPINVVVEDPVLEGLLYVGTDHGLYASLDGGRSFMAMMGDLPAAPVHDLKVHPRDRDLIVGTHGRSIYIADLEPVQQLTPEMRARPLHLFALDSLVYDADWGEAEALWQEPRRPELSVVYYSGAAGPATLRLLADDGTVLWSRADTAAYGLNYAAYDLTADSAAAVAYERGVERDEGESALEPAGDGRVYLVPGRYTLEVVRGDHRAQTPLRVLPPPDRGRPSEPDPEALERALGKG